MVRPKGLLADRKDLLIMGPGARKVAVGVEQAGEIAKARGGARMVLAQPFLADRQCALAKRACSGAVVHIAREAGDARECPRHVRMLRAERLLVDSQGAAA